MIKLVMCVARRPDLTRDEFKTYWKTQHGPFFKENMATTTASKYVQLHTVDSPINERMRSARGTLPEYDGIAEITFESEDDFAAAMSTPEGLELSEALLKDEGNFIDHSRSSVFVVEEHTP